MTDYQHLLDKLRQNGVEYRFTPVEQLVLEDYLATRGSIPGDFKRFLVEVGEGSIKQGLLTIFDKPRLATEIFDADHARRLSDIVFFSTDSLGYCQGFLTTDNFQVVEVDPTNLQVVVVADSFAAFFSERVDQLVTSPPLDELI